MPTLRINTVKRIITIASSVVLLIAVFFTAGTYYTMVNFQVSLSKVQRLQTTKTQTFILPLKLQNQGLFEIQIGLSVKILSNLTVVAENRSAWTLQPGGGGSYLFEIQLTNSTAIQYLNSTSTNTLLAITATGSTSLGLFSIELQGNVPAKNT